MSKGKSETPQAVCRRALNVPTTKADADLTIEDVIEIWWTPGDTLRLPHFPTFTLCRNCQGYLSLTVFNREGSRKIDNPTLALHVALIAYGYKTIAKWDTAAPRQVCDCATKIVELKAQVPTIVADTGWVNHGSPIRGIADFSREITFGDDFDVAKVSTIVAWLQRDNCPGWTAIWPRRLDGNRYRFTTTYDSTG